MQSCIRGVVEAGRESRADPIAPQPLLQRKIDTYMLDFVNTAVGIAASFKPFFKDTLLTEIVDPNLVYRYKTDIDKFHLWSTDDEEKVYQIIAVRKKWVCSERGLNTIVKMGQETHFFFDEPPTQKVIVAGWLMEVLRSLLE